MDTSVMLWILTTVTGIVTLTVAGMLKFMFNMSERVTRIETAFELFGKNVLKAMHRTDNFHKADELIDEYVRRDGELTSVEWADLRAIFQRVLSEGEAKHSRGELVGAAAVVAFCEHKLRAFKKV